MPWSGFLVQPQAHDLRTARGPLEIYIFFASALEKGTSPVADYEAWVLRLHHTHYLEIIDLPEKTWAPITSFGSSFLSLLIPILICSRIPPQIHPEKMNNHWLSQVHRKKLNILKRVGLPSKYASLIDLCQTVVTEQENTKGNSKGRLQKASVKACQESSRGYNSRSKVYCHVLRTNLKLRMKHKTKEWSSRQHRKIVDAKLICRVHHEKCWAGWRTSWNLDCQEKYQ